MSHVCKTCSVEMPSPGGLAIHELSHLASPPKPPPVAAPATGRPDRAKAPKGRPVAEQGKGNKASGRKRRANGSSEGADGPRPAKTRHRRRPSRAMSFTEAGPADAAPAAPPEPAGTPEPAPAGTAEPEPAETAETPGGARGKLDPTVPLTALLVAASLSGGLAAALTRAPI